MQLIGIAIVVIIIILGRRPRAPEDAAAPGEEPSL